MEDAANADEPTPTADGAADGAEPKQYLLDRIAAAEGFKDARRREETRPPPPPPRTRRPQRKRRPARTCSPRSGEALSWTTWNRSRATR